MLQAFTLALLLITTQELGDKTFFIVLILAMHNSRRWVMVGALLALALMTVVAVAAGQFLALLPSVFMHYLFIGLFLSFGIWLIWKASRMSADDYQPLMEAKAEVQQFEIQESQIWQKRLQKDNSLKVLLEAFSLTFIAEWGDRTQLATMALATTQTAWGVIIGAIAGHTVSTLIAVLGGRWVAGRISERTITWIGGGLFVLFGLIALTQNPSQGATRAILPNI